MAQTAERKRRFFAGIALSDVCRCACARVADELRATGFAARYEAPEKLHVTLAFLGFVEAARADGLAKILAAAADRAQPFSLVIDKLGAFPHERNARVVYLGAREQGTPFRRLAADVRSAYAAAGFEFAQDPVAHVTIARAKDSRRSLPPVGVSPIALDVAEIALFESLPDPARKTSRYEVVATTALGTTVWERR